MKSISRRNLLTGAGALGALGAMGAMGLSGCAPRERAMAETGTDAGDSPIDPNVSDEKSNAWLDEMIMAEPEVNGDYTAPDGTVIPAVYLRLRNRINRIGYGVGSEIEGNGTEWDFYKIMFSEEDAEHYLEMPLYKKFNANDYAAISGRPLDECKEILADMGKRGLLCTRYMGGVPYYHLLTSEWGIWEYNLDRFYEPGFMEAHNNRAGDDMPIEINDIERPQLLVMPVSKDIVNGDLLPYTSWEELFLRNEYICVAPCQCRTRADVLGFQTDVCAEGHPSETCMVFGDVARYFIERGEGRQLTPEEGIALEKEIIDAGMVPEAQWTKQVDFLCNCHGDCCLILSEYVAAEGTGNVMQNVSPYSLNYDKDVCIKCGQCIDRCPMSAISFGDDGFCTMDMKCVRCGQCALVCPAEARKLDPRNFEDMMELPDDMVADYLDSARRRMAAGLLYDFTENGLTEPPVPRYATSDGFTLDR